MRFAKGHGTENDFVILVDPAGDQGLSPDLAARLCDRRAGIGADGVLRAVRTEALAGGPGPGPAGDGARPPRHRTAAAQALRPAPCPSGSWTTATATGAPPRCAATASGSSPGTWPSVAWPAGPAFTVATRSGFRRVRLEEDGDVTAEMGAVRCSGRAGRWSAAGGLACEGLRVSVGNPHLACLVDAPLAGFDLTGPPLLDPAQFPEGGNVELVRVTGPGAAQMRVHERGSGETRSCGTGAVAAAAAAAAPPPGRTRASGRCRCRAGSSP